MIRAKGNEDDAYKALHHQHLHRFKHRGITRIALLALARWGTHGINDFVLRVVGLTSMAYAPLDIWSDTISRSHLRTDARLLAEGCGGFTTMWGGIWMAISIVVILWVLRTSRNR